MITRMLLLQGDTALAPFEGDDVGGIDGVAEPEEAGVAMDEVVGAEGVDVDAAFGPPEFDDPQAVSVTAAARTVMPIDTPRRFDGMAELP